MNWQLARYAATLRYISPATRYDMASNPDSQTPPTSNPNSSAPCGVSQGKVQEGRPRGFCFDNPRVQDATCQRLVYCRIPAVCPVTRDAGEPRAEFLPDEILLSQRWRRTICCPIYFEGVDELHCSWCILWVQLCQLRQSAPGENQGKW